MFWFIKELVERAITFSIKLSKGNGALEKLTGAFKSLLMFTTFVIMLNFWLLAKYVNLVYEHNIAIETPTVENTVELLKINEEGSRQLEIARRENRLLIHKVVNVTYENNWLRSKLEDTLESHKVIKDNNVTLRYLCTKVKLEE